MQSIYLTYNNQLRIETDDGIISTLLRKGWKPLIVPEFNSDLQKMEFIDNRFIVMNYTEDELAYESLHEAIEEGYTVLPENITLGLTDHDRTAFTQMLLLIREGIELGLISNTTDQIIADKDGTKYTITTLRFREIMFDYGMYYKNLWNRL